MGRRYCNKMGLVQVDISKPIVSQVGSLGERYEEWVHDPVLTKNPPRFFENRIAEFLTKTKWWAIPAIWLPVALWIEYCAVKGGYPLQWILPTMLLGAFSWSLLEYLLHRFIFHARASSYWGNIIHYVVHGFHHKYPMDGDRLVFPPAFTFATVLALWSIASQVFPYPFIACVFGGGLMMYIVYDLTHYYLHFGTPSNSLAHKLKRYHMTHHFKNQTHGFGVTSPLWDILFGTYP